MTMCEELAPNAHRVLAPTNPGGIALLCTMQCHTVLRVVVRAAPPSVDSPRRCRGLVRDGCTPQPAARGSPWQGWHDSLSSAEPDIDSTTQKIMQRWELIPSSIKHDRSQQALADARSQFLDAERTCPCHARTVVPPIKSDLSFMGSRCHCPVLPRFEVRKRSSSHELG